MIKNAKLLYFQDGRHSKMAAIELHWKGVISLNIELYLCTVKLFILLFKLETWQTYALNQTEFDQIERH